MISRPTYILFLFLLLANCTSSSDQIKNSFDTVNISLEKSTNVLGKSIDELYSTINSKRQNNQQFTLYADTMYLITKNANDLIDSLKDVMQTKDTSGTDLMLATNLIIKTKIGENLTKALNKVYVFATSYFNDKSEKQKLDSALGSLKEIQSSNDWTRKYFESVPTVGAITILTKFKNDCTNTASVALTDIYERLK